METHSCQQCGKVFTGSEYLTKHITRRHPQIHGKENTAQLRPAAQAKANEDIDNTVDEGARRLAELVAKAKADEVITLSRVCMQCLYHVSSERTF
jgi:predicted  nucleic acid-binding Zn-ribbon protein